MRLLRWTPEALDDLERIEIFNRTRSKAWAERVERRLVARARSLAVAPSQGRIAPESNTRLLSVPDIQYVLTYRVEAENVWIVRVHHSRENRGQP